MSYICKPGPDEAAQVRENSKEPGLHNRPASRQNEEVRALACGRESGLVV